MFESNMTMSTKCVRMYVNTYVHTLTNLFSRGNRGQCYGFVTIFQNIHPNFATYVQSIYINSAFFKIAFVFGQKTFS
jgi:hypothetical protein